MSPALAGGFSTTELSRKSESIILKLLTGFYALMSAFFFFFLFIYLYLAVLGIHCCTGFSSSCSEWGLLSSCDAWISHCCRAQALGHAGFRSGGTWA